MVNITKIVVYSTILIVITPNMMEFVIKLVVFTS